MLLDTVIILTSWLILASAYYFWGSLGFRLFSFSLNNNITSNFARIWLGWGISLGIFSFLHLFLPINAYSSFWFFLPAFIVLFKNSKAFFIFLKNQKPIVLFAILLTTITIFVLAALPIDNPDTGFYHSNTIRWINQFHIVPGIGNLHTRLGFNQLYFIYCASINMYPYLTLYGPHVCTTFLWLLLCYELMLTRRREDIIFLCILHLIPISYKYLSSPTTDFASSIFQIISVRYFLRLIEEKADVCKNSLIALIVITGALSVFIKLSNVFFTFGLILIVIFYIFQNKDSNRIRSLKKPFIFISLFAILWIIRGYIQTGYPFFPSSFGKINFDWTVDEKVAKNSEEAVYIFARLYNYNASSELLKGGKWFPTWLTYNTERLKDIKFYNIPSRLFRMLSHFHHLIVILLHPNAAPAYGYGMIFLTAFSILTLLICLIRKNIKEIYKCHKWLLFLWAITGISLLIWFFLAPAPRFSNSLTLILFCTSMLLLKEIYSKLSLSKTMIFTLLFIPFAMNFFYIVYYIGLRTLDIPITIPQIEVQKCSFTDSGLEVFLIKDGHWAYDSYLLATEEHEFNPHLRLRGSDYGSGFTTK